MPGVFISYRRSDTAAYAARLQEHLSGAFGGEYVFMDVDSLRPGEPFPEVIDATITSSDAVLALIGRDWLTVTDAAGKRRLEDPGDFVRIELATALRFDRVLIPVLLGRASMPAQSELPESLVALTERHAIEVSDDDWDRDVLRLVRRLEEVVDTIPPCPYPGMVQFQRAEADRFFGRTKEIAEIEDRLATQQLLCLVGPSGCGKSSLLEAGVLADLETTQTGRWAICTLRPGAHPVRALADALGVAFSGDAPAEAARRGVDHALAARPGAGRLLLVVDQLEELFAQADAAEQAGFVDALEALHGLEDVTMVLAIRADFYGELMESSLWPLIERSKVDVPPLAGDSLAEAITGPAQACHVTIEPDLLERLLADAGKEPGALPLLQETLVRLWGTMRLHRVSLAAYERLGVDGGSAMSAAVSDTADAALGALPPQQASIAKRVLLRLVQFGEGRPDTRRQQRFDDLRSEGDDDRTVEGVLDHLTRYRVVTLTGFDPAERTDGDAGEALRTARTGVRVDLAHESLISAWPTMRSWVAGRREAEQARRRLEDHVETWEGHGRAAAFLDDVQLREAQAWLAGGDAQELGVPPALPELVATSDARLRRRRRLRLGAIAGLVGLLIASLVLAGVFLRARNDAIHKANVALSRERAAGALASLSVDPHQSLRLAIQAADALARDDDATAEDRREAEAALRDSIRASNVRGVLRGHTAEVVSASFSADGTRVLTASWDGTARLWDTRDSKVEAVLRGHGARLEDAVFSPDGTLVATAGDDGTARLWDAARGAERDVLRHEAGARVLTVGFSPDGRRVLTASSTGTARVWDARTAALVATLVHTKGTSVTDATFSPDGTLVVTAGADGRAIVWSTSSWKPLARLPHGDAAVTMARFSPDGSSIVTASADGSARVWDARAPGAKPVVLRGHKREVVSVEFSPDGKRVVTASLDGTARLWDARTGTETTVPLAHDDAVRTATFSRDGGRILTASADHTARIWDARTGEELVALRGHDDFVGSAAFSPDGRRVVTSSFDRTARLWDAAVSRPVVTIGNAGLTIASAALSPDGGRIVTTSPEDDPRVWDSRTGEVLSTLAAHGDRVVTASFGAGGREVVTALGNGDVRVWDASSGRREISKRQTGDPVTAILSGDGSRIAAVGVDGAADPPTSTVTLWSRARPTPIAIRRLDGIAQGAAFSADGKRLVVWTQDGVVAVWDTRDGRAVSSLPHRAAVRSAAFSPDGSELATAADDDAARVWDVASGRELERFHHEFAVVSAAFSADGGRLLTASLDTTARLWDVRSGDALVSFRGHESELSGASFSPADRWVLTAGLDGTARVWDALTGQEIARFRHPGEVVGATFGHDGRRVLTLAADGRARVFRCDTCVPLDDLVRLARSRLVAGLD